MGLFLVFLWLLFFSQGILVASVAAMSAPLLPPLFAIFEWGGDGHDIAIQMGILCLAVGLMVPLSLVYFSNRLLFFVTHMLLVVYWIVCFGILGMAVTWIGGQESDAQQFLVDVAASREMMGIGKKRLHPSYLQCVEKIMHVDKNHLHESYEFAMSVFPPRPRSGRGQG
jgi:hypothetical protein